MCWRAAASFFSSSCCTTSCGAARFRRETPPSARRCAARSKPRKWRNQSRRRGRSRIWRGCRASRKSEFSRSARKAPCSFPFRVRQELRKRRFIDDASLAVDAENVNFIVELRLQYDVERQLLVAENLKL